MQHSVQRRKWSPTADDPQIISMWTANDPHWKTRNGMEFGFVDFFFNLKFIHFHQLSNELDKDKEKDLLTT